MKRLIRRRWFAATTLVAACFVAGAFLGPGFAQTNQRAEGIRQDTRKPRPQYEGLGAEARKNWESPIEEEDSEPSDEYQAPTRQELASEELMYAMKETRKLIKAYRETGEEGERAAIAKALPDAVAKEFDVRQQLRTVELEDLQQQLRHLQELHQRRAKQRDQIIEQRVHQLLQDADGLSWGSDDELQPSAGSGRKGS